MDFFSAENKEYATQHRLWILSDAVVASLVNNLPDDPMAEIVNVLLQQQLRASPPQPPTQDAATAKAKAYLQAHRIPALIEEWMRLTLEAKPENPVAFSIDHFIRMRGQAREEAPDDDDGRSSVGRASSAGRGTASTNNRFRKPNIAVVYYSAYGHMAAMAKAAAEGAEAAGASATIMRFAETLPEEVTAKMQIPKPDPSVPVVNKEALTAVDGVIFGFPTRFGTAPAQVQAFMDSTGALWSTGAFVGKPAAVMVSSATQHGGQETTAVNFQRTLMHHGFVIVGASPADVRTMQSTTVSGGTFFGPSTVAGSGGERDPSDGELRIARKTAARVADIARALRNN